MGQKYYVILPDLNEYVTFLNLSAVGDFLGLAIPKRIH